MTPPAATFLAEILMATPGSYAGSAASLFCERDPRAEERGFRSWKEILEDWIRELAGALHSNGPLLFGVHMGWVQGAMAARGATADELQAALNALRETLDPALPEDAPVTLAPYWRAAEQALVELGEGITSYISRSPRPELALAWLEHVIRGEAQAAILLLQDEVKAGRATPQDLVLDVLEPAQQEVGRLWHEGELSIGEEHFGSRTVRRALGALLAPCPPVPEDAPLILLSCVEGDTHDVGLAMLGALLELDGWRVIELGADVPAPSLAQGVDQFRPFATAISATLGQQRSRVMDCVQAIRSLQPEAKILVGGRAFLGPPGLWRETGADAFAASLGEAVHELRALREG